MNCAETLARHKRKPLHLRPESSESEACVASGPHFLL
jgi:hypothetical protein